jgi:hypothetical protein
LAGSNLTVTNTKAYNQGGAFYISGTSVNTMNLDMFSIKNTSADADGGMMFLNNSG